MTRSTTVAEVTILLLLVYGDSLVYHSVSLCWANFPDHSFSNVAILEAPQLRLLTPELPELRCCLHTHAHTHHRMLLQFYCVPRTVCLLEQFRITTSHAQSHHSVESCVG